MIRDYISASQISTFLECPLLYKKKYINGEKLTIGYQEYIIYGTAIHSVLEKNYKQKIESRVDLPTDYLVEYWHKTFKEQLEKDGDNYNEEILTKLYKEGEKMIILYMKTIAPNNQPITSEQKFKITSEKYGITILGYIDLILEDGTIIDFKNIGESNTRTWTQNYINELVQLTLYSIAYRKTYGKAEKGLRIEALKRLKSGPKIDILDTVRNNNHIEQLSQLMQQMRKLIDAGLFYPNLLNCKNCDWKNNCNKLSFESEIEKTTITVDLDLLLN